MQKRNPLLDFHPKVTSPDTIWFIPIIYMVFAVILGRLLPNLDHSFRFQTSYFSPGTAISLLSTISSGMIGFTGFVFSMLFVMVQFGSSAYTPRISRYFIQDPIVAHSLGIFISTFLYSLIALSQVDLSGSGVVPDLTVAAAMIFLLSSVIFFLLLIRRTASLQINSVLQMLGAYGYEVISHLFPLLPPSAFQSPENLAHPIHERGTVPTIHLPESSGRIIEEIRYHGRPRRILEYDLKQLVHLAQKADVAIHIHPAVGDMMNDTQKLVTIYANHAVKPASAAILRSIHVGPDRTIEMDPRFSIRLIVDIAIRALSPAINDPTTAVQALDQLYDILYQIAIRNLDVGTIYDDRGVLRVIFPTPDWNDFLTLATDEIRSYGAGSLQVMRRLHALLSDLRQVVPPERLPAVEHLLQRVNATIDRAFPDPEDQILAKEPDRQGISIVE